MRNGLDGTADVAGWSTAKYLSYALWRAWFLVMYSSPVWAMLAHPGASNASLWMYGISTVCFIVTSVLLSVLHVRAVNLLSLRWFTVACGAGASVGVLLEFAALAMQQSPESALFVAGSALTGLCTAPIAVRAGQVYAAVKSNAAIVATLLSDVVAGFIFFFCVGTWPFLCLATAAALPLLSALAIVVIVPTSYEEAMDARPIDPERPPWRSFARFLAAVFLIALVAFLQYGLGNSWFAQAEIDRGLTLGVSLLVVSSLALALFFTFGREGAFIALYRPIIFILIVCIVVAYLLDFGNPVAIGTTFLVYCLFSSYVWAFMSYLGHSRYFSPVQVFGLGRGVYSAGSLAGCLIGVFVLPGMDVERALPVVVVAMVAVLMLCAVAIRREDIESILMLDADGGRDVPLEEASAGTQADELGDVHLSPRELEVFALMKAGRDSEYIASSLCVSRNTAKTHIRNIYAKFGVHRRQDFIDVIQKL